MGLLSKFFNNARKPEGFLGKIMVNGMNGGGHAAMAVCDGEEMTFLVKNVHFCSVKNE